MRLPFSLPVSQTVSEENFEALRAATDIEGVLDHVNDPGTRRG